MDAILSREHLYLKTTQHRNMVFSALFWMELGFYMYSINFFNFTFIFAIKTSKSTIISKQQIKITNYLIYSTPSSVHSIQ